MPDASREATERLGILSRSCIALEFDETFGRAHVRRVAADVF